MKSRSSSKRGAGKAGKLQPSPDAHSTSPEKPRRTRRSSQTRDQATAITAVHGFLQAAVLSNHVRTVMSDFRTTLEDHGSNWAGRGWRIGG